MKRAIFNYFLCIQTVFLFLTFNCFAQKTAVFIIGTGRCGSSCLAGVLNLMGLDLGKELKPADAKNPKGYFEHLPIMKLNHAIIKEIGLDHYHALPVLDPRDPLMQKHMNSIAKALTHYFDQASLFGLKAGVTLLLPLYVDVVQSLGYEVKVIVIRRNPQEIAESYYKFNGTPKEATLAMVANRYALIEKYKAVYQVLDVEFNDLLKGTKSTIDRIQEFIPQLKSYAQVEARLNQFLDIGLKHNNG